MKAKCLTAWGVHINIYWRTSPHNCYNHKGLPPPPPPPPPPGYTRKVCPLDPMHTHTHNTHTYTHTHTHTHTHTCAGITVGRRPACFREKVPVVNEARCPHQSFPHPPWSLCGVQLPPHGPPLISVPQGSRVCANHHQFSPLAYVLPLVVASLRHLI